MRAGRAEAEVLEVAVFDQGRPTDVMDTSVLTCGTDPAAAALGPTELVPPDPTGTAGAHPLATTPAGPELATLLGLFDPATLGDADLVTYGAAAARLAAWADAQGLTATAELTRRCRVLRGVGDGPDQVPAAQVAAVEVGAALRLSPVAARRRVELAEDLAGPAARLPGTRAALAAGVIGLRAAQAVADTLAPLDPATARAVERRVLGRAGQQTVAQLTVALRRAVLAVDPAAAEDRRQAARADRGVWRHSLEHGLARLEWVADAAQVEAGYQWLSGHARHAQAGDRRRARAQRAAGLPPERVEQVRTLDQARSDVLADLAVDGLARDRLPTRHGRAPQIGVVVAASTLRGHDDQPAELVGVGPITAPAAREIAADGVWRRLLTDPAGNLVDLSAATYTPPQAMRDLVLTRDKTCQAPGCRTPAQACDLDHTLEHPCGPTCPANLCALCRTHHRVKTLTATGYRPDNRGGHTWTLPSGHTYTRPAEPLLDHPGLVTPSTGPPGPDPAGLDPPPF